ncbi:S8 family serine peptidase [Micromonospora sp. NPDC049559]|uniref:S8 family serine peptidase n=1 Tax=Micromonospora sp. NPDC049559 TaxID=3155923 RepID=UPI0034362F6E
MVKSLRIVAVLAVATAAAAANTPPASAGPAAGAVTPTGTAGAPTVHTVTLLTGDVVRLSVFPDGRQEAVVDQRDGEPRRGYQLSEEDGQVYVTPDEALPYVAAGRLDRTLFNISELVAEGYHDQATDRLPLLVTGAPAGPGLRAAVPATPAGAVRERELRSIGAVSVDERKADARAFWAAVATGARTLGARTAPTLSAGVDRIWLDRRLHADLTDSVPRIGAPEAWRAGYDGRGVKVAVLDSGYDPTHPDLAGRVGAAANFTGEPDTVDRFGHGTHVAATVAGRGVAGPAGGPGVAPGADLLVGKVLDATGSGELSSVIAGMEWAVDQGARVVNVSIGGPAFEGPDPAAEAVDALTASSGALFVISAGNTGPGPDTVGTPGTASSALTVGAVDRDDRLADFSSRGPRLGDGAVKPEITAPGVGIVAARAAGTTLGEVVDARYTAMSGTSMAAPHVAGAAALLAQRHPDWRADRLKAALVASATAATEAPVWAQGAGRVDVPAALDQRVTVDRATVGLGRVESDAAPVTARVTYTNPGRHPVTLDLSARAGDAGASGRPAALSVAPARLTVPSGGKATATVRLDPRATAPNRYAGLLLASGGGERLRTPVGFSVVPPTRTLTIEALDRDGQPATGFASRARLWNLDTGESHYAFLDGGQPARVELPAGRYTVMASVVGLDAAGWPKDVTLLGDPELTVDRDRTVRFDARTASELRIDTPDRTTMTRLGLSWQRTAGARSLISGETYNPQQVRRAYAAPTRPVSTGTFQFFTRWDLAAPVLTAEVTGAGGFALPEPLPVDDAPLLDGRVSARLVDGGDGTPAELGAAGVRDAVVLLRVGDPDAVAGQLAAAGAAGARAALVAAPTPGWFFANGAGAPIPAYRLDATVATRLRDRLARGPASVALDGVARSPYRYDLLLTEPGRIPADLHYTPAELRLAMVETEFHQHAPGMRALEGRAGYPDGVRTAFTFTRPLTAAQRRTDHVNTAGVTWRGSAVAQGEDLNSPRGTTYGPLRALRAGDRVREAWFPALTRPAAPLGTAPDYPNGSPANRSRDAIRVSIPQYVDGGGSLYGWIDGRSDRTELALRREGTLVGRTTGNAAQFTVPGGTARYRLTLDVSRDRFDGQPWWTTSTATSTTWSFRSGRPRGDAPAVLPLPQLGYEIDTDLANTVRADRPYRLVLRPGYQPGATGPGRFTVDVAVSYDDGRRWVGARVDGARGDAVATLPAAPAGAQFATIRVTAQDRDGNRIEQTITRAWRVR